MSNNGDNKKKNNGLGIPAKGRPQPGTWAYKAGWSKWPLAPMGHDFPRRYVDETPDEVLWDPTKILGGYGLNAFRGKQGPTELHQPRVESSTWDNIQTVNDCPPPSQLPVIKRQNYLDPSRDAETLFVSCRGDVQANSTLTIVSFETFSNLRTIIRWVDFKVYDALLPSNITLQILIDCQPVKVFAYPNVSCGAGSGCPTFFTGSVQTPTAIDITELPKDFHNSLYEITQRHQVEIVIVNSEPVDRFVAATVWGWIESMTSFDNAVQR